MIWVSLGSILCILGLQDLNDQARGTKYFYQYRFEFLTLCFIRMVSTYTSFLFMHCSTVVESFQQNTGKLKFCKLISTEFNSLVPIVASNNSNLQIDSFFIGAIRFFAWTNWMYTTLLFSERITITAPYAAWLASQNKWMLMSQQSSCNIHLGIFKSIIP